MGWDNPFSEDMLFRGAKLVINCPSEKLERELAELLTEQGYKYPDGESLLSENYWEDYGEDFCYFFDRSSVLRGSKDGANTYRFGSYPRCTFSGVEPDVEISDAGFEAIISAGGVTEGGRSNV